MSRIGKKPVAIPDGVTVTLGDDSIEVKGPKGTLSGTIPASIEAKVEDGQVVFAPLVNDKQSSALFGLARALTSNMVTGVTDGFAKELEIQGVGYRADVKGKNLNLTLGFSHPVEYELPEGIEAQTPSQTEIVISGVDKQLVGQVSAEIRAFRSPEPYKGKGVRYQGERVRRKEAKKK